MIEGTGSVSGGGTASAASHLDVHPEVPESDGSYSLLTPAIAPAESARATISGGTGTLVVEPVQNSGPLP